MATAPVPPGGRRKILLAEDDQLLRKAAAAALRQRGFDVVTAEDGEEALRRARDDRPDLILLDVIMPKVHGFEVLARLKVDPATRPIPIIMLSNLGQDSDVREAMEVGAAGYLVKSNLRLDELGRRVTAVLEGRPPR